jgi:hypothetical protein
LLLTAALAQRNLLFAQRSSVNQQRSSVAYEAAEAGLNWAQAMLNRPEAVNERCEAVDTSHLTISQTAMSFAQRHAAGSVAVAARCVHTNGHWACHCAGADPERSGEANPPAAFSLQIEPVLANAGQPGTLQVTATGCNAAQAPCTAHHNIAMEAAAQVSLHMQLGRIGGLQHALTQGITLRGSAQTPSAFFAQHFSLDPKTWQKQPVVHTVSCKDSNCLEALSKTLATAVEATLLWVDGDMELNALADHSAMRPALLGSAERPITLVVAGKLTLSGPMHIHGVLYAQSIEAPRAMSEAAEPDASATVSDTQVHGAVIAENHVNLAPSQVSFNTDVLQRLQTQTGTLALMPGSWKDF